MSEFELECMQIDIELAEFWRCEVVVRIDNGWRSEILGPYTIGHNT